MTRLNLSLLVIAAALSVASSTFAQDETASVHVRYSDLNLTNPADAAKFERRVDRAVSELCGDRNEIGIGRQVVIQECWAKVAPRAHDQVASVISAASRHDQLALAIVAEH